MTRLEKLRHRFGRGTEARKRRLLRALARCAFRDSATLLRLHETLCFMRAHPDAPVLLREVEALLGAVPAWVAALPAGERRALEESGVAGTTVSCPLSHAAARWLVGRFPADVELDWSDAETEAAALALLPFVVPAAAEETQVDVGVSARTWLAAARAAGGSGGSPGPGVDVSDAAWLVNHLTGDGNGPVGRAVYDQAQPRLAWRLADGPGSRTLAVAPMASRHFQRRPLDRRRPAPGRRARRPSIGTRRPSLAEAQALIDIAQAAVIVRYREVHAFNGADARDVVVADLGRALAVAWIGVRPEARLSLRAHYGCLLLKNGVPMGYGDASCLFDWCEIAFNVFETFRGGESAFVFVRLLDFVAQHLGIRTFLLNPYQIGRGNDEALGSGAFWFYAKLGFAPVRPHLARLARQEARRLLAAPGARTPVATLARLADGPLGLTPGGRLDPGVAAFDVGRLLRRAVVGPADSSGRAGPRSATSVARLLGVGSAVRSWTPAERRALDRLAPLVAAIPGITAWPAEDRARLAAVVRAKAGATERDYLRQLRGHSRLRRALLALGAALGPTIPKTTTPRPALARLTREDGGDR